MLQSDLKKSSNTRHIQALAQHRATEQTCDRYRTERDRAQKGWGDCYRCKELDNEKWKVCDEERLKALSDVAIIKQERDEACQEVQRVSSLLHQYHDGDDRLAVAQQEVERIRNEANAYILQVRAKAKAEAQAEAQELKTQLKNLQQSLAIGEGEYKEQERAKDKAQAELKQEIQEKEQAQLARRFHEAAKMTAQKDRDDAKKKTKEAEEELSKKMSLLKKSERACQQKDTEIQHLKEELEFERYGAPEIDSTFASSSTAPRNPLSTSTGSMSSRPDTMAQQLVDARKKFAREVKLMQGRIGNQAARIIELEKEKEKLGDAKFDVEVEKWELSKKAKTLDDENKEKATALGTANSELDTALNRLDTLGTQVQTLGETISSERRQADEQIRELEQEKQSLELEMKCLTGRAEALSVTSAMYREQAINGAASQPPQQSGESSALSKWPRKYVGMKRSVEVDPDDSEPEPEKPAKKPNKNPYADILQPAPQLQIEPSQPANEEQADRMDEDGPEVATEQGAEAVVEEQPDRMEEDEAEISTELDEKAMVEKAFRLMDESKAEMKERWVGNKREVSEK